MNGLFAEREDVLQNMQMCLQLYIGSVVCEGCRILD